MPAILVPAAAILIIVYLTIRNCGLYPSIFNDEWIYNQFSRLGPMSGAPVPSYLFFLLFGTSRFCGEGFLECVRVFNACFFALAFLFIFLVCRRYASWQLSLFVALLSALGPINAYSAYFMPESMYLFAFWLLTWFILRSIKQSWLVLGLGTGTILGLMAMIKAHAVFLIPGFAGFLLLARLTNSTNKSLKRLLLTIASAIVAFLAVRLSIGYLLAGHAGLNLMGPRYGSVVNSSAEGNRQFALLSMAKHSLIGHILALAFLFGVPLASALCIRRSPTRTDDERTAEIDLRLLHLFTIAFLVPLVLVTALSTAMFVTPVYDTIGRLHLRYYNFVFPLFLIIAAGHAGSRPAFNVGKHKAWIIALILGATVLYAILYGMKQYTPNSVDSPELVILSEPANLPVLAFLSLVSLLAWAINTRRGALLYLFVFAPVLFVTGTCRVNTDLRIQLIPTIYEAAGQFAHRALGMERSKLAIVASEEIPLYKALFQVDSPGTSIIQIPQGAALENSQIPSGENWVLLIGDHKPPAGFSYQIPMGEYSLINVSRDAEIDFRNSVWPGRLAFISGLSGPENFGRWSTGDEVRIDFAFPLPKKMKLTLTALAFGPNLGLPFSIGIGTQEQLFRLTDVMKDVSLYFESDGTEKTVTVKIPKPTSPREFSNLPDDRRLGIALQQLVVSDLGAKYSGASP
jgi:phosphoglycerol transferase